MQRFCVPSCQLTVSHGQVFVNLSSAHVLSQARPSEDKAKKISLEAGVSGVVDSGGSAGVVARLEDMWRQGLLTDVVLRTPDDGTSQTFQHQTLDCRNARLLHSRPVVYQPER